MSLHEMNGLLHDTHNLSIGEEQPSEQADHVIQRKITSPFRTQANRTFEKHCVDITESFTKAAAGKSLFPTQVAILPTGRLIKDAYFTLFESVGALEIMDPKMDSGYLAPGETLEDEYDVLKGLSPEETIGIMDELLCHEIAWHMGHPLSQTLFTSLYIDRLLWPEPKTTEAARFDRDSAETPRNDLLHVVLRAYCLALIKCCYFTHSIICRETYYEEEDFVTNLYHRELLPNCPAEHLEDLLDKAISWTTNQSNNKISRLMAEALRTRLQFRKLFLKALRDDYKVNLTPEDPPAWGICASLLPTPSSSDSEGIRVPGAFNIKIQRRLASTVPPRPIVNISYHDAYGHFCILAKDGQAVRRIFQCQTGREIQTFASLFNARDAQPSVYVRCILQTFILGEMRVLNRMSIKQFIFNDLAELVLPLDVLIDFENSEVEVPHDPRFQIAQKMELFVSRVGQSYIDISRALSMNRSRIRRMLCHIVVDWENIQLDADELDTELRELTGEVPIQTDAPNSEDIWSFPLSSWAYYYKLRQMEWIVQLGFELDVYQPRELAGMYWYLQYLARIRIDHLVRIRGFTLRRLKSVSNLGERPHSAFERSLTFLSFSVLEASAIESFAHALYLLYSALGHLSVLPQAPPSPYTSIPLSYGLRMRPFLPISLPTVPPLTEFAPHAPSPYSSDRNDAKGIPDEDQSESTRLAVPRVVALLSSSDLNLENARNEWSKVSTTSPSAGGYSSSEDMWGKETKNVLRSVIAARLAVSTVKKWVEEREQLAVVGKGKQGEGAKGKAKKGKQKDAGKKETRLEVDVSGSMYHAWWVVPKIRVVA